MKEMLLSETLQMRVSKSEITGENASVYSLQMILSAKNVSVSFSCVYDSSTETFMIMI